MIKTVEYILALFENYYEVMSNLLIVVQHYITILNTGAESSGKAPQINLVKNEIKNYFHGAKYF